MPTYNYEPPDINYQHPNGDTDLMLAVLVRNYALVTQLMHLGADPNIENNDGDSAILFACKNNDPRMVSLLCSLCDELYGEHELQEFVNHVHITGITPLMVAAFYSRPSYNILRNYGADEFIRDNSGNTADDYLQPVEQPLRYRVI